MTLVTSIRNAYAGAGHAGKRLASLYLLGGPVGVFYTLKLAGIRRQQARVTEYLAREKDLHRAHVAALNFEMSQLVDRQQRTSVAAAQFWNWCEKKAGVQ